MSMHAVLPLVCVRGGRKKNKKFEKYWRSSNGRNVTTWWRDSGTCAPIWSTSSFSRSCSSSSTSNSTVTLTVAWPPTSSVSSPASPVVSRWWTSSHSFITRAGTARSNSFHSARWPWFCRWYRCWPFHFCRAIYSNLVNCHPVGTFCAASSTYRKTWSGSPVLRWNRTRAKWPSWPDWPTSVNTRPRTKWTAEWIRLSILAVTRTRRPVNWPPRSAKRLNYNNSKCLELVAVWIHLHTDLWLATASPVIVQALEPAINRCRINRTLHQQQEIDKPHFDPIKNAIVPRLIRRSPFSLNPHRARARSFRLDCRRNSCKTIEHFIHSFIHCRWPNEIAAIPVLETIGLVTFDLDKKSIAPVFDDQKSSKKQKQPTLKFLSILYAVKYWWSTFSFYSVSISIW